MKLKVLHSQESEIERLNFLMNFDNLGMAAAACAAAAAVQRAQILMQATKKDEVNGECRGKEPPLQRTTDNRSSSPAAAPPLLASKEDSKSSAQEPIEESGDGAASAPAAADKKDLKSKEDDLSSHVHVESESALTANDAPTAVDSCSLLQREEEERDRERGRENNSIVELAQEGSTESLVESCCKEPDVSGLRNAAPFLKEIIQGKLALAAAAAVASRHQTSDNLNMEQTLGLARDFARQHNNNDLKADAKASQHEAANSTANAFMSHFLKMRQELALNMSLRQQASVQVNSSEDKSETEDPVKEGSDLDIEEEELMDEEEEVELPIDLQRNSDDGNSVQSQASPRSPSSDAGLSTSSAGKADKASRLEHIVSSMQRASPSLPKEQGPQASLNPPVNGCKKRKLYQPVQAKTTAEEEELNVEAAGGPESKKCRDETNDENADPKILNGGDSHQPIQPPISLGGNSVVQMHYMEMAKRFLQDQQDKATKEAITKEILADTVGKNNDIAEKLVSISPELKGLADILKSEITASLAIIIDSIVGRFLQATRNNNQHVPNVNNVRPPLVGVKPASFLSEMDKPTSLLPPMPSLKNTSTPSGRAPQVRDRAAPRSSAMGPVSMYNPLCPKPITTTSTSMAFPLPPTLRPAPGLLQQATPPAAISQAALPSSTTSTASSSLNNNNSEDEHNSSPSPVGRDLSPPEQDEALSLVVTPKKRRHKVTDTRITPRTLSRVLGEPLAELHKQFPHFAASLNNLNNPEGSPGNNASPRPQPPSHPLFPGLPAPPGLLAGLPTSVAIPNPSLADFNPFSSFYSPPHLPVSSAATPPTMRDNKPKICSTPPLDKSRMPRERHHSSSDLMGGRDDATPPSMLRHPSLLARGSPDFAARLREDRDRDHDEFERMGMSFPGKNSKYS